MYERWTTYIIVIPLNLTIVDEEIDKWVKIIKANILRITRLVPVYYIIGSKLWVTILIKLNALV